MKKQSNRLYQWDWYKIRKESFCSSISFYRIYTSLQYLCEHEHVIRFWTNIQFLSEKNCLWSHCNRNCIENYIRSMIRVICFENIFSNTQRKIIEYFLANWFNHNFENLTRTKGSDVWRAQPLRSKSRIQLTLLHSK